MGEHKRKERNFEALVRAAPPNTTFVGDIETGFVAMRVSENAWVLRTNPKPPAKDTDKRKGRFEERHGQGATEAIHTM